MRPLLLLAPAVLAACEAFPGAPSAGRRLARDAYVVGTSPVQIPAAAARDAALLFESPWSSGLAFPLTFPALLVWHSTLTTLHLVDLTAAPLHVFNQLEPVEIYDTARFPLRMAENGDLGRETGQILLWGAAMWGGAAMTYWLTVVYLPQALSFP